jgi:hypothetical protein
MFAGILAENSDPFRDTGTTPEALMAAASWKINIGHIAHLDDEVYPIATVQSSFATLTTQSFPWTMIERPGKHFDPLGNLTGTNYDLIHWVLPFLEVGWVSPWNGRKGVGNVTGGRRRLAESSRTPQWLGGESMPPGQRIRAPLFEYVAADEMALLVKVVVDLRANRAEFLQDLHSAKPLNGAQSASKWKM